MAIGCKTILIARMLYAYHDKIIFWEHLKATAFPYNQIGLWVMCHLGLLAIEFHDACLISCHAVLVFRMLPSGKHSRLVIQIG